MSQQFFFEFFTSRNKKILKNNFREKNKKNFSKNLSA